MEKVVIITGANSGLGYKAAEMLVEKGGYEVILACRSDEKAEEALRRLRSVKPDTTASFMKVDLASLDSIRDFVDKFKTTGKKLNILINNAGLSVGFNDTDIKRTKDGFELTFGTNHLGPFLLTNLLIDDLKKTAAEDGESRIVIVSSELHDPDSVNNRMREVIDYPFELDNLQLEEPGTFIGQRAYSRSKLANVFFMYALARRLEGTGVTATALTPGFIPDTELSRNASAMTKFMLRYVAYPFFRWKNITRTLEFGAGMIVGLAINDEYKGVTGKYYRDYEECETSKVSRDAEKGKELWDVSAEMVKHEEAKNL